MIDQAASDPIDASDVPTDVPPTEAGEGEEVEFVPDYSRVGFRDLQHLCKSRKLSGAGTVVALIERLKEDDVAHGRTAADLSALDEMRDEEPEVEEPDLLADDEDDSSPPVAVAGPLVDPTPPSATPPITSPVAQAPPAPATPTGAPVRTLRRGEADLSIRSGPVERDERVKAFRAEYPQGPADVSDEQHAAYIAETHRLAAEAGWATKGGTTIGERIGYTVDTDGRRIVIYEVLLRRQQA